MLSGVGPAEHLREHGIEPLVDAPAVGRGLQDHPLCSAVWRTPRTRNLWEDANAGAMARWRAGAGTAAARWPPTAPRRALSRAAATGCRRPT